jgi:hypothetical protein
VQTGASSGVSATTATLNGTVDPNEWQVMGCDFTIAPVSQGGATFPCAQQLGAGAAPLAVSAIATGLSPATTYTVTTTISFELSAAASVRLGFEVRQTGVIAGRKCVAASKSRHRGKRCVRYVGISGGVVLPAAAGSDRIAFDGVLSGGKRLSPGGYRLSLTATAGSDSARAAQQPTFVLLA